MNEGPPTQGGEVPTSTGAKPSIAEVAAWLRRAAEQRDVLEELRPQARHAPEAPTATEEAANEEPADPDAATGGTPSDPSPGPARPTVADQAAHDTLAPTPGEGAPAAVEADEPADLGHTPDVATGTVTDEAEARAERPTDEPEAPSDPPSVEPEPAADAGPSGSATKATKATKATETDEAVEAEADAVEAAAPKPSASGPSTTEVAEGEPGAVDLDLRDRARSEAGPVEDEDRPASNHDRRPFGIGRSPGGPTEAAVEAPPALDTQAHDRQREGAVDEPATAGGNGSVTQAAEPAHDQLEDRTDRPEVEAGTAGQAVPAVEALVEDDLPVAPDAPRPQAEPAAADQEREDEHRSNAKTLEPSRPSASGGSHAIDLGLADLAARAREAGQRGAPVPRPEVDPPRRATGTIALEPKHQPVDRVTEVEVPEPDSADEVAEVTGAASDRHGLTWDVEDDDVVATDEVAEGEAATTPSSSTAKAKAATMAMATAALQRRRAKSKRYPRGQLKERIGVLRRVRAMLGVVVLTVVLGVAAGAAIGAFIVFVAFAVRSAITSG